MEVETLANQMEIDKTEAELQELRRENEKLKADMETTSSQIRKLTAITKLNVEGTYFYYRPQEANDPNHPIGELARNFNGMLKSLQGIQGNLEGLVNERTAKLENTLDEVRSLKIQQDGDYYLTSQLIAPLSANKAKNKNVKIDFRVEQKKQFSFKKWNSSIGGDLGCAHTINLDGSFYTVFLNADAMGKSILGAGGALVLGAVFEAIIQRTILVAEEQNQTPDSWIKKTFVEIQKVFESFDGTMMISLVFGLVAENTGLLYWINAEPPRILLYREGKSVFMEGTDVFRKIGMLKIQDHDWKNLRKDSTLSISTFQLKPGDIVVIGSDGRDDLSMGEDEQGRRIINDDMDLFLLHVEQADGDLDRLMSLIKEAGEPTDDLSLLRISYEGPSAEESQLSQEEHDELLIESRKAYLRGASEDAMNYLLKIVNSSSLSAEALRDLVVINFNQRKYLDVIEFGSQYLKMRPDDHEVMYLNSIAHLKEGRLLEAIQQAERLVYVNKTVKYMYHLARLFVRVGNKFRAESVLKEALGMDPEHRGLKQLREQVGG